MNQENQEARANKPRATRRYMRSPEVTVIEAYTETGRTVTVTVQRPPENQTWAASIEVDGSPFAYVMMHETRGRNALERLCRGAISGFVRHITKRARLARNRAARKEGAEHV